MLAKPHDCITARMFGDYLTLPRWAWENMGKMDGEDGERCREIATRPGDQPGEATA